MAEKNVLKEKWLKLPQPVRTKVAIGALMLGLMTVASLVMSTGSKPVANKKVDATEANLQVPARRDNTAERMQAATETNSGEISRLKSELEVERTNTKLALQKLEETQKVAAEGGGQISADMIKELMAMKAKLDELEKRGPAPSANTPLPSLDLPSLDKSPAPAAPKASLRVSGAERVAVAADTAKTENKPIAYLPAGSMFEAVLLNGMDAPTSGAAQKNPVPALLRVKTDALLPNNFNHNIRECFVLVSGFGVLSSERVQLRTETMSCIEEDGRVIEAKVDGYVVGEDGRVAPRGRLVSKQGQLIAKSLAAGVLSGFAQAITPQQVPQLNLMPGSSAQTQTMDASTLAQSSVAKGFSDASKATAAFFLDMAKEMTPVVELDAARKVTVVLIKGIELK